MNSTDVLTVEKLLAAVEDIEPIEQLRIVICQGAAPDGVVDIPASEWGPRTLLLGVNAYWKLMENALPAERAYGTLMGATVEFLPRNWRPEKETK